MSTRIEQYRQAGRKAVDFQLRFQQPDGGYIWEGFARNAYHKQTYSWMMSGEYGRAQRLLNWVKANTLLPDGGLKDYNGDTYRLAWFFQGAHRLGRFDISYPVMDYLLSCQTESGGWPVFEEDAYTRVLPTAWAGVAALYAGRVDVAERAAAWCVSLLEQQNDDTKFYYEMTPAGKLVTLQSDPKARHIDATQPKQPYWEVGLPQMLMCRMFTVTGYKSYIDQAARFFERHRTLHDDRFTHTGSGKSSLANAVYYLLTDDERARDAVMEFCDHLVETQTEEGSWLVRDDAPLLNRIDAAAEFSVWLQENAAILESKQRPSAST